MTAPRFFHFASVCILFAWSGVLLYYYASGRVANVLTESFHIGPLIGGLGLAVVGIFNLCTSRSEAACCHDHGEPGHDEQDHQDHAHSHSHDTPCHHHEADDHHREKTYRHDELRPCGHTHADGRCEHHGHDHHHHHDDHGHDHHHHHHHHDDQTIPGILATLVIVLIPAIGGAALSEDRFTIETLANKGLYSNEVAPVASPKAKEGNDEDRYTLADLEKQVRKSEEGNFIIPIPSLFYSAADEELADVLTGQPIETTGQVAPEIAENDPEGTRLRLYRLFVSCCLADARPIGFSADFGKAPPQYAEDTWVKIVGKMTYPDQDGRRVPVISVDRIETIPEPEDMMY